MDLNKNSLRLVGYLTFIFVCIAVPWFFFCLFIQYFSFEIWDEKSEYIENIGYLGSFVSGLAALIIVVLTGIAVKYSYNAYIEEKKELINKD